jgi:hypothetical protein
VHNTLVNRAQDFAMTRRGAQHNPRAPLQSRTSSTEIKRFGRVAGVGKAREAPELQARGLCTHWLAAQAGSEARCAQRREAAESPAHPRSRNDCVESAYKQGQSRLRWPQSRAMCVAADSESSLSFSCLKLYRICRKSLPNRQGSADQLPRNSEFTVTALSAFRVAMEPRFASSERIVVDPSPTLVLHQNW